MTKLLPTMVGAFVAFVVAIGAPLAPTTAGEGVVSKNRITVNGAPMTATLIDSATTRDFVSVLPVTIPMRDLFAREKSGDLSRSLSEGGERKRTYEVGEVIYWSPSAHLAIFYLRGGPAIPSPGIIVLGKIDSGVEALNVPGSVAVTIEAIKQQ
jgi:hypothetical protein